MLQGVRVSHEWRGPRIAVCGKARSPTAWWSAPRTRGGTKAALCGADFQKSSVKILSRAAGPYKVTQLG
ncbi:hypothetical protein AWT69_001432 [Pseudomonas putida]|nr:hypothetical protein AWT69_001432 [Pseudomonas putida]